MLKLFILATVLLTSSAFANPAEQMLSTKDRLRLSLWVEGIKEESIVRAQADSDQVILPEEIERALKKL